MKFTKEQVAKELRTKLAGENGKEKVNISERTILNQVETLLPLIATDETEMSEFVEKVFPAIQTLEGQLRKDNADFAKSFEENYKKPETPKEPEKPEDGNKSELELIREKLEAMEKAQNEELNKRFQQSKLSELKTMLNSKGVKDDEFVSDFLNGMQFTESSDLYDITERGLRMFNKSQANIPPVQTPGGAGGGKDDSKEWDDIKQARKQQLGEKD